ncbi:DUF6879 family protein [Parafrankia sp. FMc2]|uniref:DUF6879 family protein n=1 Tax=Parafrankia sp. FMc2 TaxID=3233196 RepID=UPI0034D45B75
MLESLAEVIGVPLDEDEYLDDFWPRFQKARGICWKLERRPVFLSPEVASWVALDEGDWNRSLAIMDGPMRQAIADDLASTPALERRRVRIVEHPLTPYLQWEMQVFRHRTLAGERIRILDAARVAPLETRRLLPEVLTLDDTVLYEVLYAPDGEYRGARRVDDPVVVRACVGEIARMYDHAEDFRPFFAREVAMLPPPAVTGANSGG